MCIELSLSPLLSVAGLTGDTSECPHIVYRQKSIGDSEIRPPDMDTRDLLARCSSIPLFSGRPQLGNGSPPPFLQLHPLRRRSVIVSIGTLLFALVTKGLLMRAWFSYELPRFVHRV